MSSDKTWVTVHTSSPHLPPSASRPHVTTPRLLIRPLQASDLDDLHKLRTQPDVMRWSAAGRVDLDTTETAQKLADSLPPRGDIQTFNCAVCWRETGEFVGIGGVYRLNRVDVGVTGDTEGFGWPELGYMILQEYWGMGLATEFVKAFLQMWEELERKPIEIQVNRNTLVGDNAITGGSPDTTPTVREELVAVIDAANIASQRILEKDGFERFVEFEEHQQDPNKTLTLHGYRWFSSTV